MCERQEVKNHIKVLKDLRTLWIPARYRHVGPKGPKEVSLAAKNRLETRALILKIL